MPDAIRLHAVRKSFGPKVAVGGVGLSIARGELCGLIGPNGAGKTTTIRMVMGILFPDSGELEVLGRPNAVESRRRVGYLPEERGVYRKMRVGDFLTYMGRLRGLGGSLGRRGLQDRIAEWLERVELPGVIRKRCEELSKGMQQKVQFIAAVMHEPELLILDEPFSGLDPVNMALLRELIDEQHRAGRTVIFSTHVMAQAEQVCDRIVMIHDGQKVLDDTLAKIRAAHEPRSVLIEPIAGGGHGAGAASTGGIGDGTGGWDGAGASPEAVFAELPGVASISTGGREHGASGVLELHVEDAADPVAVMRAAVGTAGVRVARAELRRPTLEDIFVGIVRPTGPAPEHHGPGGEVLAPVGSAESINSEAGL